MNDKIVYNNFSSSEYYDWVVSNTNNAESIYYLIRKRLAGMLYSVFKTYGYGLDDAFEDTVDDFFLYLYEWSPTGSQKPFAIMEGIRNKAAFFGWIISTYRFFLLNKTREEEKRIQLMNDARLLFHEEDAHRPQEAMVHLLTTAIAYADQHFTPRNRFVCYRMLLSLLDHTRAIPQERMAQALEMHPVTYRVCTKRQKDKLGDYILLQEAGRVLKLDLAHQTMRDRMTDEFHQLYELLMEYYNETLGLLPTADKIKALRIEYGRNNGTTVHEEIQYGFKATDEVRLLFGVLNKMS